MSQMFRELPVTGEQLRDDCIVEEAISDPLHLPAVFGFRPAPDCAIPRSPSRARCPARNVLSIR
jgi:hypothetical protein